MSPLVCLVLAFSLGTVATNESSKLLGSERKTVSLLSSPTEEPEERSVSKLIENVNKNNALLEHGDIRRYHRRNAAPCTASGCKWPKSSDGFVYVPVSISSGYTSEERNIIINALLSFHSTTCIRFYWRSSETSYLHFFSGSGCWSYVGHQGGRQDVSLQARGCLYLAVVQHEVLHALGFHHEHVRSDRDSYVRILTGNIIPGMEHNFQIEQTNNMGTPYDFNSVMQYHNTAFSVNGKSTIISRSNPNMIFGTATQMSRNDIDRVKRLYQCS